MTEEIFDYKKECSNLLAEKNALLCRYEEIRAELQRLKQENENAKTTVEECHKYMAKLEDENEKLENAYDEISNNSEILHENNCLRIANQKLSEDLSQAETSMRVWRNESINYKKALEEIREIADDTFHCCDDDCGNARKIKLIIDEINEALGNDI